MFQTQPQCKIAMRMLIQQLLATMLTATPDASHVDLYAIGGRHRHTDRGFMQYSLATSVTRAKRIKVSIPQDRPLTDWESFLRSLQAGRCRLLGLEEFQPSPIRDRFCALDDSKILICPVIGPQPDLLGAVFLGWSGSGHVNSAAQPAGITVLAKRIASQVARVLDLYAYVAADPAPWPVSRRSMSDA